MDHEAYLIATVQPLHNLPGEDATPCPVTGLAVTCRPHWTDIAISSEYTVTFKMIGDRILYTEPRGDSQTIDVERLYRERELVLSEHLGAVEGYVEIRNYSAVKNRPPRDQRNQQVVRFREEGARTRGFIAFNLSPLVKQLVRLGLTLNQTSYPFEIVNTYDTAVVRATRLLETNMAGALTRPGAREHRSWIPEFLSQRLRSTPSQEHIDELVTHIGRMTWDVQGNQHPDGVATDHPLSPIYEAVALVKQDVDEVLAERDAREQRLRELAQRVEASARAKSVFMASMSHEIRTPMSGVLGLLDLLAEDELTQQQLGMVRAAREGARSLMSLLGGLLDLSELEAGKIALQEVDFDLLPLVEEAAALTAPLARAKGLEFNTRVSPRLPGRLRGDPARLQQLLANLAGEAVKSTEEGGITIRVRAAGTLNGPGTTALRFEVIYTGAPVSEQPCLFAVTDGPAEMAPLPGSGTGTGLTICRLLAELMGGELGVKSEQKAGAAFWFTAVFKDA